MLRILIVFFILFVCFELQGQDINNFFIDGTINVDIGIVELQPIYDYNEFDIKNLKATVKDGKFSFSGRITYPQAFEISYDNKYWSRLFIVDPGEQTMVININNKREVPHLNNSSMNEYFGDYLNSYNDIKLRTDRYHINKDSLNNVYLNKIPDSIQYELEKEIKGIYKSTDSVLLNYVTNNPDSYLALWKTIELFTFYGYNSIIDSIYTKFSIALQNTYSGNKLRERIEASSILAVGKAFPVIAVVNVDNNQSGDSLFKENNQYTFVDFWYSECGPCIAQFPHLRTIYSNYKDMGFEIVGISTDKIRNRAKWEKAIEKYSMNWPQYWDKDGLESEKLTIKRFPTNYLIDSNGIIIMKDLRPIELDIFLKENLSHN